MKRWLIGEATLLCGLVICTLVVQAEDDTTKPMGGYTIEGVPNEHQIDKNVSYFFLEEQPGEKDQIKIKLLNDSTEEKTLNVKVTNANTNSNGLIDYTGTLKDHASLKTPLTSIVKPQVTEVKVAPKSETETKLDIQMPEEKQEGIILGGVVVSEKSDETKKEKNASFGNAYRYTLGVVLTNDKEIQVNKNKEIELEKVGAILSDGRKIVQADLLNPTSYIFGEAIVSGKILNKSETQTIRERKKEKVKIAPHSVYPFQFDWKKEELKPGNYVFEGQVKTKERKWVVKQAFMIRAEEAKQINEKSVFKLFIPVWLKLSVAIVGVVTLITTVFLWIRRKRYETE